MKEQTFYFHLWYVWTEKSLFNFTIQFRISTLLKIGKICCTSSISFLRVFLNGINPRQGKCLVLPLASYGPEYQDYITIYMNTWLSRTSG